MTDPIQALKNHLEDSTNVPYFIVLVFTMLVVLALAHGTTSLAKRWAQQGAWGKFVVLTGLLGFVVFAWWDPLVGLLIMGGSVLILLRKPLAGLLRAVGRAFRWGREKRRERREKRAQQPAKRPRARSPPGSARSGGGRR